MGILRLALGEGTTNMKLFVFACLVAMALAEASPRLMPIPTTDTATVLATPDTTVLATPDTDTVSDTSDTADTTATARGPLRLRLSPTLPLRPRLIPTTDTTAMDTTVLDTDVPTD